MMHKASQVMILGDECYYPSNPALALGLLAAISLLIGQVVANASGGCVCCCTNRAEPLSDPHKTIAVLCLVLSWVTFTNAFFLLGEGASRNSQRQYEGWEDNCYIVKPGVFAAGSVLAVITAVLSIVYYLLVASPSKASVALGQPVISTSQVLFSPPKCSDSSFDLPPLFVANVHQPQAV
eukprot:c19497_g1_i2 orf=672-1211(+)